MLTLLPICLQDLNGFQCLVELEGPDFNVDGNSRRTMCSALIQGGQLLQWLESKGFALGLGIITGDSAELLTSFIHLFMDCALDSLQKGRHGLLQYLINKNQLDSHILRAWQTADTLLDPAFVGPLLPQSEPYEHSANTDNILINGLKALATDVIGTVRASLCKEIATYVGATVEHLLSVVRHSSAIDEDWIETAERLWTLREYIAASGWLQPALHQELLATCKSQTPLHSLTMLHGLETAINEITSGSKTTLRSCFDIYVQSFLSTGICVENETTAIPYVLHRIWVHFQRQSVRDLAVRIAFSEAFDVTHRVTCIKKLPGVSEEEIQGLRNCLFGLSQNSVLEIVNIAIVIDVLQASPCRDPCWRALLIHTAKSADVRIDRGEFTALGYSAYRQCVEVLHKIVGDEMVLVQSTHKWLEELRSVESVFTTLEADGDSYSAIHCILVEKQPEIRTRYSKMLQCFMKQSDSARKLLMQELIVALRDTNSASVSQAVLAISKVDAKGFAQCEHLLMVCRKDKNLAAARLAVWLKMDGLNDATEAALSSLGKVLNLGLDNDSNPPPESFEAAKNDYARRVAELVVRAQQLERTRLSLRRSDPDAVNAMVESLGLEAPLSGVATLMGNVPRNLASVIDEVGDDEILLQFPLSKELNAMEHIAFGLKGTEICK